jgi:carbon storage regulator
MLQLLRTIGQRIIIGDKISIKVKKVIGNKVDLEIDAPREIKILRNELLNDNKHPHKDKKQRGNK